MKNRKGHTTNKRSIISIVCGLLCIVIFAITISDGTLIPNWKQLKSRFNLGPVSDDEEDFLRVLNVGQGDSILLKSNGKTLLLDTGPEESTDKLCDDLDEEGIDTIDVLMISHFHCDHTGGLKAITNKYKIKNMVLPELTGSSEGLPAAETAKETVIGTSGGVYTAVQGMNMKLGDFIVTILYYNSGFEDENNRSIVAMAEIEGKKFLLTGDAEKPCETDMIKEHIKLDCDVLKVGHHGSETSSSKAFLDVATPEISAISVGKTNQYGHPDRVTLDALKSCGSEILRTDKDGNITFYVEDGQIKTKIEDS